MESVVHLYGSIDGHPSWARASCEERPGSPAARARSRRAHKDAGDLTSQVEEVTCIPCLEAAGSRVKAAYVDAMALIGRRRDALEPR